MVEFASGGLVNIQWSRIFYYRAQQTFDVSEFTHIITRVLVGWRWCCGSSGPGETVAVVPVDLEHKLIFP